MDIIRKLRTRLGETHVLDGAQADAAPWRRDWIGKYRWAPLCVVRPGSTQEVSAVMRLAFETGTPVVPVGGNTGLAGGTSGEGAIMLSLDRMNAIREIRPDARIAVVEAGVVLSALHEAAGAQDLSFPMTFGARGSATLGGMLATNAGGSNVLRYGNMRALCLGLEVVLADGRVMDLMSELHKDNSGLDLRDLMIGAEGTLGVITGAVLKVFPAPRAHATAMVAAPGLAEALTLLNRLQEATGGAVEAFEYMPGAYIEAHLKAFADARAPFAERHEVNILAEIATTAPDEATPGADGKVALVARMEDILAGLMQEGALVDAVIAQNEAQRREMWTRREAAAEVMLRFQPRVDTDIALPLDAVAVFLDRMRTILPGLDPGAGHIEVAHLGDGNIHYSVCLTRDDAALKEAVTERVEDVVKALGGSFSAEHGIGLSKKGSMARRKDPVALAAMRAVKAALDPKVILNPGKVFPA